MAGDIIIHHVNSERLRSVVVLVVYNIIYTQISCQFVKVAEF